MMKSQIVCNVTMFVDGFGRIIKAKPMITVRNIVEQNMDGMDIKEQKR